MATTLIPLRSIPVIFPGADNAGPPTAAAETDDSEPGKKDSDQDDEQQQQPGQLAGSLAQSCLAQKVVTLCTGGGMESKRVPLGRDSAGSGPEGGRGWAPCSGAFSAQAVNGKDEHRKTRQHTTAKRYRLHTMAGPLTSRMMDNGFVIMSLELVASGNDLLGEPDELDSEEVTVRRPILSLSAYLFLRLQDMCGHDV